MLGLFRLGSYDLQTDEGRFGVSGLNILADPHQLATVSEDPLGGPGTKAYMYPLLEAVSIYLFGKNEYAVRSVNVLILLLTAFFLYGLAWFLTKDRVVCLLSLSIFLLDPGTLTYARTAMPEPSVVLWGCAGLYVCAAFYETEKWFWAVLCGAALGLAFLSKFWLVLPFGLACFALFALKFIQKKTARFLAIPLAAFVIFLLVGSSHLLLVWLLEPRELSYWLGMYLGTTLSSRAAGGGFDPAMWFRPWWFYLGAFFKASFFGLPLVFLGVANLWKDRLRETAAVVASLLLLVPILSVFIVKEAAYMFPAYPGIVILMALGLRYFFRRAAGQEVVFSTVLSMLLAGWFFSKGVFELRYLLMIEALYFVFLAAGLASQRYCVSVRRLTAAGLVTAMLFTSCVAIRRDMVHRTFFRETALYFKKDLQMERPQEVSFVSGEYPSLSFYTFRTGQYWQTYNFQEDFSTFESNLREHRRIFYIADRNGTLHGGSPSSAEWQALQKQTHDITPDVEKFIGHNISFRIFVPVDSR
jgi:4-amino-4-deoxy-L-arabinose transferase-like glycosyltransferase